MRNIFHQKSCKNDTKRLVPNFFVFEKVLSKVKAYGQNLLVLIHFGRLQLGHIIKTNFSTIQSVDPDFAYFISLYFTYNFSRKIFSCYIVLTDSTSFSDYLYSEATTRGVL